KMGHRYYDPQIGRFTQPDPSGQEQNPYLYADGDPVNRIDPTGLFSFADTMGIVTGTLAGAAGIAAVGSMCAITAGVGCAAAAIITGATWGAGGGALGSVLAGGNSAEGVNGTLGGLVGGASSGLAALFFG
ncbi:RHS repeat-associated core domain-containing protein, partial [Streptomyces sp. NPDC002784]